MTQLYSDDLLRDLIEGRLSLKELREVQRRKDTGRFARIRAIEQQRVPWKEQILLPLQENLYVVERQPSPVVKCFCGQEFGDYRRNWKESALVYERDPQDGEVFRGPQGADPEWVILREFYCPGCAAQLDVEVVPSVYPFIFNFEPDLEHLSEIEERR